MERGAGPVSAAGRPPAVVRRGRTAWLPTAPGWCGGKPRDGSDRGDGRQRVDVV